jgi:hypothetical protein
MHISRRKLEIKAVAGVPRESSGVSDSITGRERCVSKVIAGRPTVSGYDKNRLNEETMKLILAVLVGFFLGSAVGSHAQWCCAQYNTPLDLQNEMDHAALIQEELRQPDIPLPRYTFPALPCDR